MIVVVDGNIGVGKSTLMRQLHAMGCDVREEGVCRWGAFLQKFYGDPARHSLTLQLAILADMAEQRRQWEVEGRILFAERSPDAARIFVQNSHNNGHIDGDELALYEQFHRLVAWRPDVVIRIRVPTDECLRRIRERARPGEEHITRSYLDSLEALYDASPADAVLDGRQSASDLVRALLTALEMVGVNVPMPTPV